MGELGPQLALRQRVSLEPLAGGLTRLTGVPAVSWLHLVFAPGEGVEHAPVVDNCANCHVPHGSSQPRMLKVRSPMLCQQCHSEGFHPSTLYNGEHLPPNVLSNGSSRILAKGCMNCHPAIHGTNHPSGPRLTR